MQRMIGSFLVALLASVTMFAMDDEECKVVTREGWGARAPKGDVSAQAESVTKIVIGHTVTSSGNAIITMRAIQDSHMDGFGFADIGYNFCLDVKGICYEGRPVDKAPALLKGHNMGSCGVGCIGRFDQNQVSEELAIKWGKQLGKIAHLYGFEKLVRGENIFGMSELSDRFPLSPGEHFMVRFDLIVEVANLKLQALRSAK